MRVNLTRSQLLTLRDALDQSTGMDTAKLRELIVKTIETSENHVTTRNSFAKQWHKARMKYDSGVTAGPEALYDWLDLLVKGRGVCAGHLSIRDYGKMIGAPGALIENTEAWAARGGKSL